ncbi:MAG: hypothetical protein M1422_01805 [Candidatus Thermoplasmatota archaeon]|nr:hypothetical protein [Candidatus Thermoplasmatota archaeon]MCL5253390.1 hypothetical protein [Candidatus Thermoplasmatota archaeon]
MLLNERPVFILKGVAPLQPVSVEALMPYDLPETLLPSSEISVFGKAMELGWESETGENEFSIALHFVPSRPGSFMETWGSSARVLDHISVYVTQAAATTFERLTGLSIARGNWSAISMMGASVGTLTINGKSRRLVPDQIKSMDEALFELKRIEGTKVDGRYLQLLEKRVSKIGLLALFFLMDELYKQKSPITIRWHSGKNESSTSLSVIASKRLYAIMSEYLSSRSTSFMREQAKVIVRLTNAEVIKLKKPVNRNAGGWQLLLSDLQNQFIGPNELEVRPYQVEKIVRYFRDYGAGSFQTRLRPIYLALYSLRLATYGLN